MLCYRFYKNIGAASNKCDNPGLFLPRYLLSDAFSVISAGRKRSDMHHTPASATTVYMILLMIESAPPPIQATRSNEKRPTLPQLRHPIIEIIRAILSMNIMFFVVASSFENRLAILLSVKALYHYPIYIFACLGQKIRL